MKKIENNFAVKGFVGKDAEIRQFTTASVARFSLAIARNEKNGEENSRVAYRLSSMLKYGARTRTPLRSTSSPRVPCSQSRATSSQRNGATRKVSSISACCW